jgi:hypothetical protein
MSASVAEPVTTRAHQQHTMRQHRRTLARTLQTDVLDGVAGKVVTQEHHADVLGRILRPRVRHTLGSGTTRCTSTAQLVTHTFRMGTKRCDASTRT